MLSYCYLLAIKSIINLFVFNSITKQTLKMKGIMNLAMIVVLLLSCAFCQQICLQQ